MGGVKARVESFRRRTSSFEFRLQRDAAWGSAGNGGGGHCQVEGVLPVAEMSPGLAVGFEINSWLVNLRLFGLGRLDFFFCWSCSGIREVFSYCC